MGSAPAFAQSGEITIWSWNVAASSLKATIAGFNKQFPDVKVTVQALGNQPTYDKSIAGCAAGPHTSAELDHDQIWPLGARLI